MAATPTPRIKLRRLSAEEGASVVGGGSFWSWDVPEFPDMEGLLSVRLIRIEMRGITVA
jgi:hypothetical protein